MSAPFSPGYEAKAAMPFTFSGVQYARGDRFPYRDLGIIDFDLRGLWAAERIRFTGAPYVDKPPAKQQPQQQRR